MDYCVLQPQQYFSIYHRQTVARLEADYRFSLALCSPQPWNEASSTIGVPYSTSLSSLSLENDFQKATNTKVKPGSNFACSYICCNEFLLWNCLWDPSYSSYCHNTTPSQLWFHNSLQVQWHRAHNTVNKSHLNEELILELNFFKNKSFLKN